MDPQLNPLGSSPSAKQPSAIKIEVICAILAILFGGVGGAIVSFALPRIFPSVTQVAVVSVPGGESVATVPKVLASMPPLILYISYSGHTPGSPAALGKPRTLPTWWYSVSVFNNTAFALQNIAILAEPADGILPVSCVFNGDKLRAIPDSPAVKQVDNTSLAKKFPVYVDSLGVGQKIPLLIGVANDMVPSLKELGISAHCDYGDFVIVDASIWNQITWK
jgi:hypothetical protein